MNQGAIQARGEILWFLHADSIPDPAAHQTIQDVLSEPQTLMGAFRFAVDSPRPLFRFLEWGVRTRSESLGVPYGDQGLFLRREDFMKLGGYPEVTHMEDLYLVRAVRAQGQIFTAPVPLLTSARRWEAQGYLRTSLRNWGLVLGDWLGLWGIPSPSPKVRAAWIAQQAEQTG